MMCVLYSFVFTAPEEVDIGLTEIKLYLSATYFIIKSWFEPLCIHAKLVEHLIAPY